MWRLNLVVLILIAPVMLVVVSAAAFGPVAGEMALPMDGPAAAVAVLEGDLHELGHAAGFVRDTLAEQQKKYERQHRELLELAQKSALQRDLSDEMYEQHILDKLGPPVRTHRSARVEVKVFALRGIGYRGFIAKVKPFDPQVLRVVHRPVDGESTSAAARRTGAVLAINGGGFYTAPGAGRTHVLPIGNTMVDGKLIGGFQPSRNSLFFAGFNASGRLVGDIVHDQAALNRLGARQGVSFVPILIRDQKPIPIPQSWRHQRQPRTLIGEYANGDLIMIVVDGRQADWSGGVTLEDLQVSLLKFGVVDAYNLDGGGSSVFVFDHEILNRPSDGRQRYMATNIVVLP